MAIQSLTSEGQLIVREGLTFDYPDSTAIIPDPRCRTLRGFLGADWVAQEYLLTPDEIEEIYMVDVGSAYTAYNEDGQTTGYEPTSEHHYYAGYGTSGNDDGNGPVMPLACVWEIYHRKDGTVYVVCDGHNDFLQEPGPPETEISRFWPWFSIVLNEGYDEKSLFPQSDIDLIRDMQLELNRSRQGLREHRRANRPKVAVAAGLLEAPDLEKLRTHPANALLGAERPRPGPEDRRCPADRQDAADRQRGLRHRPGLRGCPQGPGLRSGRSGDHFQRDGDRGQRGAVLPDHRPRLDG